MSRARYPRTGELLRSRLAAADLDQKTVAKSVKATPPTVSRWFSGERFPDFPRIKALCKVLKIEPIELETARDEDDIQEGRETEAAMVKIGESAAAIASAERAERVKSRDPWPILKAFSEGWRGGVDGAPFSSSWMEARPLVIAMLEPAGPEAMRAVVESLDGHALRATEDHAVPWWLDLAQERYDLLRTQKARVDAKKDG